MNKKIFLSACTVCFLGLFGCTHTNLDQTNCTGPDCLPKADYVCQTTDNPELCPHDPFVNYTRTAADFREYGERTPRDHLISQSGAGNNLSAAVPPSIEDEVISYEEQLEQQVQLPEPEPDLKPVEEETIAKVEAETVTTEDDLLNVEVTEEVSEVLEEDTEDSEGLEDPVQDWLAEEGQNLKALLSDWSEQSGWRLIWNTNRNYVLNAGAMFRGRFADVSSALIRAFARARPAPIATFYKGNRVLVVETMEDENAYE